MTASFSALPSEGPVMSSLLRPRTPSMANQGRRAACRPMLETLENRFAPAGVFDGGGDGVSFNDPLNWDNNVVPDATVDVLTGPLFNLTSAANQNIRSLSLDLTATLNITGGTFEIDNNSTIAG